ncbi:hemerythrin domain-containing protein [Pendulispora brunnea]|uniref:hemerythrin domain-containing protein n=1 Tax=Pendulispora brunnea TaxID=2905690 RepID=UPI00374E0495
MAGRRSANAACRRKACALARWYAAIARHSLQARALHAAGHEVMHMTIGDIERFMVEDHTRIDHFLAASEAADGIIDESAYAHFRHDLLRHIGMEEKVLLPFARTRRGGAPLEIAAQLRRDHGEIARLLAGSPTLTRLATLREILARHNALEEGPDGLYAACDVLAGDESAAVVAKLRAQPSVPLAPYFDGPPREAR